MKKLKILVSVVLAATMIFSSTFAFAAAPPAPSVVTGTNTITNPTFAVLLPTAPAIRLNPFQIGLLNNEPFPQIHAPWSVIANRSNIPIQVDVRIAPAATAGTAAIAQTNFVGHPGAIRAGSRDAFLNLIWASGVNLGSPAPTNTATAAALADLVWDYESVTLTETSTDTVTETDASIAVTRPFTVAGGNLALQTAPTLTGTATATLLTGGGHQFRVLLDAHSVVPETGVVQAGAITDRQLAAFTFRGAIPYDVTWTAGQVAARVVFTVTGISNVTYASTVANATPLTYGHRVFTPAPVTP